MTHKANRDKTHPFESYDVGILSRHNTLLARSLADVLLTHPRFLMPVICRALGDSPSGFSFASVLLN